MKKFLLILFITVISSSAFAQSYLKYKLSPVMTSEGKNISGFAFNNSTPNPIFLPNTPVPPFAIPGLTTFSDYVTNGNTLNQIYVNGDTVVVAFTYVDSANLRAPNNSSQIRMAYNYSLNGGTTWESNSFLSLTEVKSRYPDMAMVVSSGVRTVSASGRVWISSSLRAGGIGTDIILGAGNGSAVFVPGTGQSGNTDLVCAQMTNGKLACIFQSGAGPDTIYFLTFDPGTLTFSSKIPIHSTTLGNSTADYKIAAGTGGNLIVAYNYINEPNYGGDPIRSVRYQTSSDFGVTWNPPFGGNPPKILGNAYINGDSCHAYWHEDIVYKPGTSTPYIVFPTYDYTTSVDPNITRKAWKIIGWSPALNGGNPIVVADYNNIPVLQDTNTFNLVTRVRTIHGVAKIAFQVNAAVLSHPSIGFSSDGNSIYCAFSVTQVDTSGEGFNFYDIWITKSTNAGLNWSTPVNITNSPLQDEMYPALARTGNNGGAKITYQSTRFPGCQGFGPTGMNPAYESDSAAIVYQCYQTGVIGIKEISKNVPSTYSLMQNYPNPFNPSTKIKFEIKNTARVSLTVYNITGQLVTTIIKNEVVSPGTKEVEFYPSSLASGVYFYTITINDINSNNRIFSDTRKMIVLK